MASFWGSLGNKLANVAKWSIPATLSKSPWISLNGSNLIRPITTTPILLAEPMKKKKRLDPAIVKAREQRKLRKLEKAIRKLQKNARQLKPLDELQVPTVIQDKLQERLRPLPQMSTEEVEARWLLEKQMAKVKFEQHSREVRFMERLLKSQEKALNELKNESEDLYYAAIEIDMNLLPYVSRGPVETPPNKNYETPEGDYFDISRKYEGEQPVVENTKHNLF